MPIYMDRHIVPGIVAKDAAKAHREDLMIQEEYGCRCMTYWVDEENGSAFCLIDAPDKEAVEEMHKRAHGLIPHEIVQVNSNVVEAFLGRIHDPDGYNDPDDPNLKIFNDPAFRIILVCQTINPVLLQKQIGQARAEQLCSLYREIYKEEQQRFEGREVESEAQGFITSFVSVTQAVDCAKAIQKKLHIAGELLQIKMGLHAGMPVDESGVLFGDTVKMAKYFCNVKRGETMLLSSIISEIYKSDMSGDLKGERSKSIKVEDENFLLGMMDLLYENIKNPNWGISDFCKKMAMSKSKLYRKCTQIIGMSPNELFREHRLLHSLNLLKTERNIMQTCYDVGFTSPSYFTKCFQERFGMAPLSYVKQLESF